MKRLEVTTLIQECSDCPYANIWGLYCGKYKRTLPELDRETHTHTIPDWCELENLSADDSEEEEFAPELTLCYYNNGTCEGIGCMYADHESVIRKDLGELKFKCKKYGIWVVR